MSQQVTAAAGRRAAAPSNFLTVPDADMFDGEYLASQEIENLAQELIAQYPQLGFIAEHGVRVVYLWKAKGGTSGGKARRGACQKLGGLPHFFSDSDFCVWLAADHLRDRPNFNFRRLVFHELKHITLGEKGNPAGRKHDFEGFVDEVEEFGIWDPELRPMAEAFQQHLFEK